MFAASRASATTCADVVKMFGTVQRYDPVAVRLDAIVVYVVPPSLEYFKVTDVTPLSALELHDSGITVPAPTI